MIIVREGLMDHSFGIFALGGTACAKEVLVLDNPEFLAVIETQLFARFDVRRGEKTNSRKSEILMIYEHLHWDNVRFTSVVNESCHVVISPGVDAVSITVFIIQVEKVRVVFSVVSLRI